MMKKRKKVISVLLSLAVALCGAVFPGQTVKAVGSGTSEGAYGFFYSRGSTEAMEVLNWGKNTEGSTEFGGENDTTRLELMLKSLEYIEECNSLRANHGLPALLVTDYMMATAMVQLNWSDTNYAHSQFFNVGENLSWGYGDHFEGWYTSEKQLMESGFYTSESQIGHYLNIINTSYTVTGFAVSLDKRGRFSIAHGQTFGFSQSGGSGKDHVAETPGAYRAELQSYINAGGINAASLVETVSPDTPLDASPVPIYRLYNPNSGEHFYTSNATEKANLVSVGWRDENLGWTAPSSSNTPVYRMYNDNAGDHHYTVNYNEVISLLNAGWSYEGIGWYSNTDATSALYRVYNPNAKGAGSHHYTTSAAERDSLVAGGWRDESVGWYGL